MLLLLALGTRIWAAIDLPNAEQDGYSYAEIASRLTDHIRAGQLALPDFYGFWLPLFQSATAVLNLAVHNALAAGKIINALAGAANLLLIFDLTKRLTGSIWLSAITFLLALCAPLQFLYSAACMTDVPHCCLVLASLCFAVRRRWIAATIFAALAGCVRVEAWALVFVLPLLQWLLEGKISLAAIAILLVPPLSWLLLTDAVTGNPLSYFQERARYHSEYIHFHPERLGFALAVLISDARNFLSGATRAITIGAVIASAISGIRLVRGRATDGVLIVASFYIGMLGLIVVAYLSKSQPVLLPRYGLLFFASGLPLFAWTLQWSASRIPSSANIVLRAALLGLCVFELIQQAPTLPQVRDDFRAHQRVTTALVNQMERSSGTARCFSDDVAVRVISRLPAERFLRSAFVPPSARANQAEFVAYLREQQTQWLIFYPIEDSLPVKFFPDLAGGSNANNKRFELVTSAKSNFGPDIWLYRSR